MNILERLSTGFGRTLPMVLQTEATECGLACISMIAGHHGFHADLRSLRQRFPISLKGAGLPHLIKMASRIGLASRAIRADLSELSKLKLPCILHWNFNHFVVLKSVSSKSICIYDPAQGPRDLELNIASQSFTGVVLELWPTTEFAPNESPPQLKLRALMGKIIGLKRALLQILILALVLEVFTLLSPLLLQWILDNVIVSSDRDLLAMLVIGFGLLLLMQQGISAIRAWSLMHLSTTLGVQWKANVFTHLLKLPIQFFEKRHIGDVVSRFGTVDSIQQTLTTSFLAAVLDGLMTLVTLTMMFIYSPVLGFIALAAMTLYACGRAMSYQPFRDASQDAIVKSAKTQSHFLETVRGMKAIQLFHRQQERRSTWLSLFIEQVNANLKSQKLQLIYQQMNGILFGVENLLVIYVGARMVMDGDFTVGMLIAFNSYKGQFDSRVGGLIDNFFSVKMLQLQGERLADIVLTPVEEQVDRGENDMRNFAGEIEAVGVEYRYAHGEPTILNGIDLCIRAGTVSNFVFEAYSSIQEKLCHANRNPHWRSFRRFQRHCLNSSAKAR